MALENYKRMRKINNDGQKWAYKIYVKYRKSIHKRTTDKLLLRQSNVDK